MIEKKKNPIASLFADCWKDEAMKARLIADPKAVLAEHGLDLPDGMDVKAGVISYSRPIPCQFGFIQLSHADIDKGILFK
jgi:hypothetical protein